MSNELTPQDIKDIRDKYGLSQKSFARLLGLGEASISRYEKGQQPTKANANLIRAAKIPKFVMGCLDRDGDVLSERERSNVEKIIYADVYFGEGEDDMDMTEVYEITLTQEVLTEKAWAMMAELFTLRRAAEANGEAALAMVYRDVEKQLALLTPKIATFENSSKESLAKVKGELDGLQGLCNSLKVSFSEAA